MKKILKWTGFVVGGIAALVLIGVAYLYFASERELGRRYEVGASAPLKVWRERALMDLAPFWR